MTASSFSDEALRNPALTVAQAAELAARLFGVTARVHPLGSHEDQNFLLDDGRERFVLKIAGGRASPTELKMQNAMMQHLARAAPGFAVPEPRAPRDGGVAEAEIDGQRYLIRLLTYLEGETFEHTRYF